jgi:hypothetical protein
MGMEHFRSNFAAGPGPASVVVGHFVGDGVQDLAVANELSNTISILLGKGDGTFQPPVNFDVGTQPVSIAVGDFNGDGVQDLVVANSRSDTVSVLLGKGDGTFQAARNFGAGSAPFSVVVGDFNGDNVRDLAVANASSNTISVLLGPGGRDISGGDELRCGQCSLFRVRCGLQSGWYAGFGSSQRGLQHSLDAHQHFVFRPYVVPAIAGKN